jgi:hypothetical protein
VSIDPINAGTPCTGSGCRNHAHGIGLLDDDDARHEAKERALLAEIRRLRDRAEAAEEARDSARAATDEWERSYRASEVELKKEQAEVERLRAALALWYRLRTAPPVDDYGSSAGWARAYLDAERALDAAALSVGAMEPTPDTLTLPAEVVRQVEEALAATIDNLTGGDPDPWGSLHSEGIGEQSDEHTIKLLLEAEAALRQHMKGGGGK